MADPYLLLWLEAPLQSWGVDSVFDLRDTLDFPTKSGVLGLICCARGAAGAQTDWLAQWASSDMTVVSYPKVSEDRLSVSRPVLLEDFHTVGTGYDDKNPWENLMIPKTSEGKKAVGSGAKLTYRYYLQDAAFAVMLQGSREALEEVSTALQTPVWDVYLGRKSCVPTDVIYQGVFDSLELAREKAELLAQSKARQADFIVKQGREEGGETLVLTDVPVAFGDNKTYSDRYVTIVPIED